EFMQRFSCARADQKEVRYAQGLFGYSCYDAVQFFDTIRLDGNKHKNADEPIPLMRYRLYQYVIAINHFKDELFLCENRIEGIESESEAVESLIRSKDVPVYPFKVS